MGLPTVTGGPGLYVGDHLVDEIADLMVISFKDLEDFRAGDRLRHPGYTRVVIGNKRDIDVTDALLAS